VIGEPTGGFKVLHADDVGTRLQHMMDLQDQWSTAYGILTRPGYHSALEESRAKQLETALDLLQHHMEAEYNGTQYAVTINDLPKDPKEIPDEKPHRSDPTTWRDTV
jgi:hypothetical protein